jgi:tetratricopeptide (TPR) repeat protein
VNTDIAIPQNEVETISKTIDELNIQVFELTYEDTEQAFLYADSMLALSKKIDSSEGLIKSYYSIGSINLTIANYPRAIDNFEKALAIAEINNRIKMLPKIYTALGIANDESGRTNAAIQNHFNSLRLSEKIADTLGIADSFNNVGIIFASQEDYQQAISYYVKALNLIKLVSEDSPSLSTYYSNLGDAYFNLGKKDSALLFHQNALLIDIKYQDKIGLTHTNLSLGQIYIDKADFGKASIFLDSALEQAQKIGDKAQEVSVLNVISQVLLDQNLIQESGEVARKSYTIASSIDFPEGIRDALKMEASALENAGKYKEALEKLQLYHEYVDKIKNEQKVKAIIRQQAEYDFSKERLSIELERKNREDRQRLTYIGLILSTIIIILMFWFYFDKRRNNKLLSDANQKYQVLNENLEATVAQRTQELVKRNKQLEEFADTNSHKVRHSLAQMLGITALIEHNLAEPESDPKEEQNLIKMLNKAAFELDTIVKEIDTKLSSPD